MDFFELSLISLSSKKMAEIVAFTSYTYHDFFRKKIGVSSKKIMRDMSIGPAILFFVDTLFTSQSVPILNI